MKNVNLFISQKFNKKPKEDSSGPGFLSTLPPSPLRGSNVQPLTKMQVKKKMMRENAWSRLRSQKPALCIKVLFSGSATEIL